jgi:hypothetical protein
VTTRTRAEAALLATTLIWGGTFAVVKIGMRDVSPLLLIAVRFLIGGALMVVLFGRRILPLTGQAILKGSILACFLFLGFVTQNIGLTITTASKSAFITGMMVVFVPLLQIVIERRPPKVGNVVGVGRHPRPLVPDISGQSFTTVTLDAPSSVLFAVHQSSRRCSERDDHRPACGYSDGVHCRIRSVTAVRNTPVC